MNSEWFVIHWARLDLILPLLVVCAFFLFLIAAKLKKTKNVIALLAPVKRVKTLLIGYAPHKSLMKSVLWLVGIFSLCVALLRPQGREIEVPSTQEGRDILIALDVSRSMLAQDLEPDRLTFAKNKIKTLVKQLKTERLGLLLFAGSSFLQCPLTDDKGAFLMFLNAIDADTISSGTTSIEHALQEAITVFDKVPERKSKLLLIFTDGEDFSSNLTAIKQKAAEIGLHIITIGVGTMQGAPIPLYDLKGQQIGHQLDEKDAVVISRLNEGILHRLAQDTGGVFVPIKQDNEDIEQIKKYITSFEKEKLNNRQVKQFEEQYAWPLLVSFVALLLEWLL